MSTTLTLTQLASAIATAPERAAVALRATMPAAGIVAVGGVKQHFQTSTGPDGIPWRPLAHPRPRGGEKPLLDTGQLRNSVSATTTDDTITLRANGPGARLHQLGGVITPKRARALAIPITTEARRAGSPRRFPRPLFAGKGPKGGYLAESKGKGKRAKVVVHYLLRTSVPIPARPFMGFSVETMAKIESLVTGRIVAAVAELGGG